MPAIDVTALRKKLRRQGYAPIPVNGKKPPLERWTDKTETNDNEIELWSSLFPGAVNTGVLARATPGLDIDLLDEAAAVAVEDLAKERFGERGRFLVRIGKAPKRLIPLRTDAPFKKITLNLIAGNERAGDKIEVLGDGQQMVVAGEHPDTKKPYRWVGGALWDVAADELPLVTEAELRAFVVAAGELLVADFGYRLLGAGAGDDDVDAAIEGGRDWGDCITGILNGEALHDNILVLAAKQVAAGIDGGVIVNFIRDLLQRSQALRDERWQERYDDIPRAVRSAQQKYARPEAPDDEQELEKLARMPRLDYERARTEAAKRLGVRSAMLDKLVAAKRIELGLDGDDNKQGRAIELPEPTPWETPVDGAGLLNTVAEAIRKHVVLPDHARDACALWIAHTYLLDRLMITPRLAITSPTRGCGKPSLLDVAAPLVFRPLLAANCSPSSVFRVVEGFRPCLLIDEADSFLSANEELRGILNSGHRRGGAVLRNVGDEHEPRSFSTFAACAIALIGQLPGTLADRSVPINLVRRKANEAIEPFRFDRIEHLAVLARKLMRWTKDNADAIAATEPQMPAGLYNRTADNWRGLIAVATVAGGDWLARSHKAALQCAGADIDEGSRLELLLGDLRSIFDTLKRDWISSAELIENLVEITPRPWPEYGKSGKPITQNKLARLLKPLGVAPGRLEVGEDRARGYFRARLEDAFERYLGVSKCPPVREPDKSGTSPTFQSVRDAEPRTDTKVQETQHSSHRGHMDTLKGGNGPAEPLGLSDRTVDELAEWVRWFATRHVGEPDIDALIERALRERLRNKYDVRPGDLDIEAKRVMARAFGPLK